MEKEKAEMEAKILASLTLQLSAIDLNWAAFGFGYWQQGKAITYFIVVFLLAISACFLNTWTGGLDSKEQRKRVEIALTIYNVACVTYFIGMMWSAMHLWRHYFLIYTIAEAFVAPLLFCGLSVRWRIRATHLRMEKEPATQSAIQLIKQ
jgi:hypothetical protein